MEHDLPLRAAARVIYETCFSMTPATPLRFEVAERQRTERYLHSVAAAQSARSCFTLAGEAQPLLI